MLETFDAVFLVDGVEQTNASAVQIGIRNDVVALANIIRREIAAMPELNANASILFFQCSHHLLQMLSGQVLQSAVTIR